jgi:thioredoxin 1
MTGEHVVEVSADNWQNEVVESDVPVVVDFWAEWCGPCRAIAPILDQLADELGGKIKVAKVNVDHNQQIAGQFGIRSIPTLLIFKDGQIQEQMVGAMNKAALQGKLNAYV